MRYLDRLGSPKGSERTRKKENCEYEVVHPLGVWKLEVELLFRSSFNDVKQVYKRLWKASGISEFPVAHLCPFAILEVGFASSGGVAADGRSIISLHCWLHQEYFSDLDVVHLNG
jgi:hypothetical protein